jgi:DNA-binding transcriptional ArsR family regulator
MRCIRREQRLLWIAQQKALNHPLRVRILELHKRARGRSLSVELLTEALSQTQEYGHVKPAEVQYHRALLQDAELIPGDPV